MLHVSSERLDVSSVISRIKSENSTHLSEFSRCQSVNIGCQSEIANSLENELHFRLGAIAL